MEKYPSLHARRNKFERGTNVYRLPLPWRPGWRNLLSGRPMGGNRFPDETFSAIFRRCLRQVPYYVPPVVIANMINLLLLVFVLGAVEIVPLFLRTLLLRRGGGPHHAASFNKPGSPEFARTMVLGNPPPQPSATHHNRDLEDPSGITAAPSSKELFLEMISSLCSRGALPVSPANASLAAAASDFGRIVPAVPEDAGPVLDATLYYVFCFVSVLVAVFGNVILVCLRSTRSSLDELYLYTQQNSTCQLHHHRGHYLFGAPSPFDRIYDLLGNRRWAIYKSTKESQM